MLLREHLYLLLPCAAETLRRSTKLLKESSLDKQIIKKLHSKNNGKTRGSHCNLLTQLSTYFLLMCELLFFFTKYE